MPRNVVITGGKGFLGWHLRCRLRALTDDTVVVLGRGDLADPARAAEQLALADLVFHLAGVNRGTDTAVFEGNIAAARQLIGALRVKGCAPQLVCANSIHATGPTPYGRGKAQAVSELREWAAGVDAPIADVRLPNLFGEHGRPHYNSVVATFCHQLARREQPTVERDAELPLLHAQQAAHALVEAVGVSGAISPEGSRRTVTWIRDRLTMLASVYRDGDFPDLADTLDRDLFNTYRSHCFPEAYPMVQPTHGDERGRLFECARSHGGQGQTIVSSSYPGITRGQHFHLHKVERFLVMAGEAQIALRRLFDDSVVRFDVRGTEPMAVDMPTMWAHSITNTGRDELHTLFWAGDLFDPKEPDTFAERVEQPVGAP